MNKKGYIYILFNKKNGTLYVGVTSDLIKRIYLYILVLEQSNQKSLMKQVLEGKRFYLD